MKRLSLFVFLLILGTANCPGAVGPDVEKFFSYLKDSRVSAEYSCKMSLEGTTIDFNGSVTAQDNCFHLKGNGIELFCDGAKLVMLDPQAKEAYIEPASSLEQYVSGHIAEVQNLDVRNLKRSTKAEDFSEFTAPLSSLGKDWIITDLSK